MRNDLSSAIPGIRTEINEPIRAFDDIEVVLDDEDGSAAVDEALEEIEQDPDILEMQSGRGFIKKKEGAEPALSGGGAARQIREVTDQFQPLAFAAGKGVDGLAETKVPEASFLKKSEALRGAARRFGTVVE